MAQNPNPKTQNSLKREFHYYPFGMCFDVSKSPMLGKSSAVKFNSQLHDHDEFEDANGNVYGLEDYNFAFRNYDAQIGRWLQPDPLMQHPSPYLAMSNNPVSFTDPLGLFDGNPILDRNGYPIAGLFSTDGAYYQVDWALTVSNGHNVGSTSFYVSEMDEYNYKMKSLNKYFSPLYNQYFHTMYANGNLRRNGEAYGEVAARYFDNQLAWGMNLKEKASNYNWGRMGNAFTLGGIVLFGMEKSIYNSSYWVDAKGNIKSTELLNKGANGKYVKGVQGLRNGKAAAANTASKFSVAGKVVGGLGMVVTGTQFLHGQISATEATVDMLMGAVGFTGWGAPISVAYFGSKLLYETTTGNTLFEKPKKP